MIDVRLFVEERARQWGLGVPDVGEDHGVPHCTSTCPQHDGKRCMLMGCRPGALCEPFLIELIERAYKDAESAYAYGMHLHGG